MSEILVQGENEIEHGLSVKVELAAVPADEVEAGTPQQGTAPFGGIGNCDIGIWELRGGTVTDTEVDEVFVVLSGGAILELIDEERTVEVIAGDVMRLVAGTRTRWTVEDHIRKVYISAE